MDSSLMDGRTIRLRASCNACNESKVRCTQLKPTCTRCERNGAECIYGLSRRTHKNAPPISMPSSRRSTFDLVTPFANGNPLPPTNSSAAGNGYDANSFYSDTMTQPHFMVSPSHQSLLDYGNFVAGGHGNTSSPSTSTCPLTDPRNATTTTHFPPSLPEFGPGGGGGGGDPYDTFLKSPFNDSLYSENNMGRTSASDSGGHTSSRCACHAGVTELLASMRDDRRLSLDAQLTKLKRCIVSSETSMRCAHTREDVEPIHIMAVATLIGYMIGEFEMLIGREALRDDTKSVASVGAAQALGKLYHDNEMDLASCLPSPTGSGESTPTTLSGANSSNSNSNSNNNSTDAWSSSSLTMGLHLEPRLSWGVLQLEDDDEADLRQRLTLLSFRRLEKLLTQLKLFLRSQQDAQSSLPAPSPRHMAFFMACDYTRLWLENKAKDVKVLFSAIPAT